jgi:hypothetical protein
MDISTVKIKDTTVIDEFYDPAGDLIIDEYTGKPVTIEIFGAESDQFRKMIAKRIRAEQIKNKGKRKREDEPVTDESLAKARKEGLQTLAECTVAWTGFYRNGDELACTVENAIALYEAAPFIRKQVDAAMGDESAFFEKQPSS